MKKVCFVLMLLCQSITVFGQVKAIKGNVVLEHIDAFWGVDTFDNYYYSLQQSLFKKGSDGEFQFADLSLGSLTHLDLLNPFKLVLFYSESNTAVILDNTLNEINRIDFNAIASPRLVTVAKGAGEHKLWIFNQDTFQLEMYDFVADRVLWQAQPESSLPFNMVADYNTALLVFEKQIVSYNNYGIMLATYNFDAVISAIAKNNLGIYTIMNDKWLFKPKENSNFAPMKFFVPHAVSIAVTKNFIYVFDGSLVTTYSNDLTN